MTQNNESQNTLEKKILRISLACSLGFHLLIALSDFFPKFKRESSRFNAISAELYIPIQAKKDKSLSMKSKKKEEKTLVHKNTLPQLPEKFVIKEKTKEKTTPLVKHSPKETKKKEEEREKKKREALELTKKEALKRLLREKARLEKQNADREKLALQKKLDNLASIKKNKLASLSSSAGSSGSEEGDYAAILQQRLHEHYEIPDAFNLANKKHEALLEITLSGRGKVISAKIISSSGSSLFDKLALNTVWKSSPFSPPPREWIGEAITINFKP